MRLSCLSALVSALSLCSSVETAAQVPAGWQHRAWEQAFMIWPTHAREPRPWRVDSRLYGHFTEPGFPDDIQVVFLADSVPGPDDEAMWVTIIAHDPRSDEFLGILGNAPNHIKNVVHYDNVVFRWDQKLGWPVAIDRGGYGAAGWPRGSLQDSSRALLIQAVRAYRAGEYADSTASSGGCIPPLEQLTRRPLPNVWPEERYLIHFLFGRCLAETYQTLRAIDQFRAAVDLQPDSLDAHMGLLAEYSVMAATPAADLTQGTESEWEAVYLRQVDLVRERFASNERVIRTLDLAFDETGKDLSGLTPQQIAKRRRTGFAVIRWKQR